MVVFAHILGWPPGGTIELGSPKPETGLTKVTLLGYSGGEVSWSPGHGGLGLTLTLPDRSEVDSSWGFVLRMVGIGASGNSVWK